MSADNWTVCPACAVKIENKIAARKKAAADSYGKVSAQQYLKNLKDAETDVPLTDSLREDYDCRMDSDGNAYVFYSCACDCGFGYSFKHEMKVPLSATWREYQSKVSR